MVSGGAGVEGVGGLVQSPCGGPAAIRPKASLRLFKRGKLPVQQRLLKSSRSIVQATAPPKPPVLM